VVKSSALRPVESAPPHPGPPGLNLLAPYAGVKHGNAARQRMGNAFVMEEIRLDAVNGRSLTLEILHRPEQDIWRCRATLALPQGSVSADVWDMGTGLARFFRDLANSWNGFEGSKDYRTLEGQLVFSCQHDGRGTVTCKITLRQPEPPEWSLGAIFDFGAGAHLERLADEVEAFMPY
jgi:hypothetical protein